MFQHTAARRRLVVRTAFYLLEVRVSTHSRPKAAGFFIAIIKTLCQGFNTQPPEGGWLQEMSVDLSAELFQHTAARRRLEEVRITLLSPF